MSSFLFSHPLIRFREVISLKIFWKRINWVRRLHIECLTFLGVENWWVQKYLTNLSNHRYLTNSCHQLLIWLHHNITPFSPPLFLSPHRHIHTPSELWRNDSQNDSFVLHSYGSSASSTFFSKQEDKNNKFRNSEKLRGVPCYYYVDFQ